jgi:hypothetical protein
MARARATVRARQVPAKIVIPDLSDMIPAAVLRQASDVGFTLAVAEPRIRFEDMLSSARWTVVAQDPVGGSVRYQGDTVVVIMRHQGGGDQAGDREPRHPLPLRRVERAPLDDELIESTDATEQLGSVRRLDVSGG